MRPACSALALFAAVALAGCGQTDDRAAVRATSERFLAAYKAEDGAAACAGLSSDTRKALQNEETRPCPQAIRGVELDGGAITHVQVSVTNAKVDLASGESMFLSEQASGWRISALGCRPDGPPTPPRFSASWRPDGRALFPLPDGHHRRADPVPDHWPARAVMRRFVRDNGLGLFFGAIFLATLAGQALVGHADFNHDQLRHHDDAISLGRYVLSSDFGSDVMENWQSEYLQFTLYILMTVWLLQRGSPESKAMDKAGLGSDGNRRSASTPTRSLRGGRGSATGGQRSTPTRC